MYARYTDNGGWDGTAGNGGLVRSPGRRPAIVGGHAGGFRVLGAPAGDMHSIPRYLLGPSGTPWYVRAVLVALVAVAVGAFVLWQYPELQLLFS